MQFLVESIEIFPSPGHTEDSCSVFFHHEKILAVGDNLEKPLPYLENNQWDQYLNTLDRYQSLKSRMIYSGHGRVDRNDIKITRQYILDWQNHDLERYEQEPYREIHQVNVQNVSGGRSC